MATLSLHNLTRHHAGSERPALDSLDLDVPDGELLVLVGPSGCGKSTALRLIAGLDAPDGGHVRIDGRDVTAAAPQDRDVAMVFQGYALYPHLSARDNIAFPLRMRGVPRGEREARVGEVAALLGIGALLGRKPGELSGGERQRVAMGRAIVRRPKVFLFDEPLANLDAALRAELRVELAALVRRLGTTSIYVTHDQAEAMTMGDRICVMQDGRLQQIAVPRDVYEAPANLFVAGFLGAPPMNRIELARGSRRVIAGVRPEHLALRRIEKEAEKKGVSPAVAPERIDEPFLAVLDGAAGVAVLRARVTDLEPLGAETHVRLSVGDVLLWARAPGFDAPSRGAAVEVTIEPRRILWFDAATGARLDAAREAAHLDAAREGAQSDAGGGGTS